MGAALWLLGLYFASSAIARRGDDAFVERLRNALILGVAIPLALGLFNVLYPAACAAALAACLLVAYRRHGAGFWTTSGPAPYVLIAALALVSWPALMRPPLEGDSLSYHLPNAASWVQSHGVWTTATRYWWYPPASELFASALYAVGGPFAVGWSGAAALALAGFRIFTWARDEFSAPAWLADALAAAIVTALPLALQAGTLQNDAWLAAFWLESLWLLRRNDPLAPAALAVCALVKPDGWIFAAIAAAVLRARPALWVAPAAALALWIVRDGVLARGALGPSGVSGLESLFRTSIAAHGPAALALLVAVTLQAPLALLALVAAVAAPFALRGSDRALGWCALLAVAVFLCLPFGYDNGDPQLATGQSVRFAAPAIVLGGLLLVVPALRASLVAASLFIVSAIFGADRVLTAFATDLPTLSALAVAPALAATVAIAVRARIRSAQWIAALVVAVAAAGAAFLAQRNALLYYNDALSVDGTKPGVYAWIAQRVPAAIGGWGLRLGVVNVLSPPTRTIDLPDAAPCEAARAAGVLLATVAESTHTQAENARRLGLARGCGTTLFGDAIGAVVRPRP